MEEADTLMDDAAVQEAQNTLMPMDSNLDSTIDGNMDQNLDDLFGEAADGLAAEVLTAAMPSTAPLPQSLVARVMEMQTRGCCTKVAWAPTGSIAQITDHGKKIVFRALVRNMKTGDWRLTQESRYPIEAPEGTTWKHVCFSGIGIELAAVDSRGQVQIFTLVGALGKMRLASSSSALPGDGEGDLSEVVGMHWLPLHPMEFKIPYITPAIKQLGGDKWETEMRMRDVNEASVHHAAEGRHALLHVTRDGKLTLMYQNDANWQSTSAKLAPVNTSSDLISHAAIGPEGGNLLLVTHDEGLKLRVYRISISWNRMQAPAKEGAPPNITVAPTLEIAHLTMLEHVAPQVADGAMLSELHLLPRIPPVATDPTNPSLPMILAIFTRATAPNGSSNQGPEAFSVTARWNIETLVPNLHPAFDKLKPKSKNTASQSQNPVTVLQRQDDLITNKIILSVQQQYYQTTLAFGHSDGTIEFRDRVTLAPLEPYGDTETISSLSAAGFEQGMTDHNTHIAISADGSAMALLKPDDTLTHKMMNLRYSWQPSDAEIAGLGDTKPLIEAAVVALARQYCILACSNTANDETLALLPKNLSSEMRSLFVKQIIRIMKRFQQLDISMMESSRQQVLVLREPLLPRALSAGFVVGTKKGTMERDCMGKFAFAALNLRLVCTAIAQLVGRSDVQFRPETLVGLRGNVVWGADVLVYIANYLVSLRRSLPKDTDAAATFTAAKSNVETTQSPVLNLLLCTWTRCYVRFLSTFIPKYLALASKYSPQSRTLLEKQLLQETYEYGTHLPFKFAAFEALANEVDAAVREAYTEGQVQGKRRAEIELTLITGGELPTELEGCVQRVMEEGLGKFMEVCDLSALYFRDTSWIGVEDAAPVPDSVEEADAITNGFANLNGDPANRLPTTNGDLSEASLTDPASTHGEEVFGKTKLYDTIRKLPIPEGSKLRRCRRCPAIMMEDFSPERTREMPGWFAHSQRHCVCGNYWIY